jgi:hypothetical protein
MGNEERGYPVPDLNRTIINVIKEPSDTHIRTLKEEILEDITEKFIEKILEMVNQNIKMLSRNFKTPKMKSMRRNSERTSANTKVNQRTILKERYKN